MSLVQSNKLDIDTLISKMTCEPAAIIGEKFGKLGTLEVGSPADITLFDPDLEWVVDTNKFASRGKNTPLGGITLKGKVKMTFFQGKVVYKD
jgi:dihydroorotase